MARDVESHLPLGELHWPQNCSIRNRFKMLPIYLVCCEYFQLVFLGLSLSTRLKRFFFHQASAVHFAPRKSLEPRSVSLAPLVATVLAPSRATDQLFNTIRFSHRQLSFWRAIERWCVSRVRIMKISLVIVLTCLACAVAQEEFPVRRNKRTAHFLLHQFADLLGYDIIPKSAVVTDIRSRLGLPPLQTLGQPQAQTPQTQTPQTQTPQTQPPPKTSTMGTSTTTGGGGTSSQVPAKTPTTSAQAPPSSEGPVRLPLPLNILNRFPSTIPILNPIQPTPPATPPAARLEQPVALQHTNLSLNFLFSRVPTSESSADPATASDSASTQTDEAPTGPSAETPSIEDENPPRFVEDNFVFNPRDVSGSDEDYNPNLAFSGWRPPRPEDDFAFEESSEVKYNPAPTTRSATPARLDPVLQAYPHNNYISAFRPVHRRRSAMSQHSFRAKGSDYGYVTYH